MKSRKRVGRIDSAKTFCDNTPKRGEEYREFADESRKYISGLPQFLVIPLAEKCSGGLIFLRRPAQIECANDMLPIPGKP